MKRRSLIYLLTFSLALNGAAVATLAFLRWKGQAAADEVSFAQKPVKDFFKQDLGLTDEESRRLLYYIDLRKPAAIELRRLMNSKRLEMMDLITTLPVNTDAVEAKVEEINRIQGQVRLIAVGTIMKIFKSLPPDSATKFRAYLLQRGRICDECGPGMGKGLFPDSQSGR
jgi:Spy/CpxP family protein refolding chaperone